MDLSRKLAELEVGQPLPKVSIKDLTKPSGYKILSAKRVGTRFNRDCIMLEVEINSNGDSAITFLPKRFVDELSSEDLDMLGNGGFSVRATGQVGESPNVLISSIASSSRKRK